MESLPGPCHGNFLATRGDAALVTPSSLEKRQRSHYSRLGPPPRREHHGARWQVCALAHLAPPCLCSGSFSGGARRPPPPPCIHLAEAAEVSREGPWSAFTGELCQSRSKTPRIPGSRRISPRTPPAGDDPRWQRPNSPHRGPTFPLSRYMPPHVPVCALRPQRTVRAAPQPKHRVPRPSGSIRAFCGRSR